MALSSSDVAREDWPAWLRLLETPGLGRAAVRRLLARFGTPEAVLCESPAAWRAVLSQGQVQALAVPPTGLDRLQDQIRAWLDKDPSHGLLMLGDADYPSNLLNTADPPLMLFLQGRRELLAQPQVAIVGSRHPSHNGRELAQAFGKALSAQGLTVVSGLALGIDTAAHEGALQEAGSTIAVLGSGLDHIYPKANAELAARISKQGLLLSEFPLGTGPHASHFPVRNRIIAGLSEGCLVVEAALKSGSLITARLAAEAGREVFAIPGSIHSPQSKGCHALLREGAKLVECVDDIVSELRGLRGRSAQPTADPAAKPQRKNTQAALDLNESPSALSLQAQEILDQMGFDPVSMDSLEARGGWPTQALATHLLELELEGRITRLAGALFQRKSQV
ncbi:MAG: DNA-protecting protein DprA [Burkholderiaceae bacterium]|nr:DNA-protecting protein DprA [Roseateles sp.]MBV8469505.1 DNA-protecting protein DprA [Burkholderiaceae bacterium]